MLMVAGLVGSLTYYVQKEVDMHVLCMLRVRTNELEMSLA